jgi:hypothetical protein
MGRIYIFEGDWSAYDNRKKADHHDCSKFDCKEPWEVSFLVNLIARNRYTRTKTEIRQAIKDACAMSTWPRKRNEFIDLVMRRLQQR